MHQNGRGESCGGNSLILTNTHVKPSGASGWVDLAQLIGPLFSSLLKNASCAARSKPIPASKQIPQKVTALTVIMFSPVVKSWPFIVQDAGVALAQAKRDSATPAAKRSIPHGNHGDNLRSVQK